MTSPAAAEASPSRLPALDVSRGIAVTAMAAYHFGWDLSFYGLIEADIARDPGWQWVARIIAGSFLALVGASLALAHREGVRWPGFLRRLGRVAGAALLITAATLAAFPDSPILFGILHCIALSSVLALPLLRAPVLVIFAVAAGCALAPLVLTQPGFDRPLLDFLGLGRGDPRANDYVPLLPWFAPVCIGLIAGRAIGRGGGPSWLARLPGGRLGRGLAFAGRHSLAIYLVHQPLLLAALYPVAVAASG